MLGRSGLAGKKHLQMACRYLALAGAAIVVCLASSAHAAEGWYVSGQAGGNILQKVHIAPEIHIKFDPGYSIAGAVGYRWNKFRVEGEIAYTVDDIDKFEIGGANLDGSGDFNATSFMANVFRDFELDSPFLTVNVGAGLGVAKISINDAEILGVPFLDDDDTVFAYQIGGGIGLAFTQTTTVTFDYRFFSTTDAEFGAVDADYDSHIVRIGVRYMF